MKRARDDNARVLARMRIAEHLDGDPDALAKLSRLPWEEALGACFEALDDADPPDPQPA